MNKNNFGFSIVLIMLVACTSIQKTNEVQTNTSNSCNGLFAQPEMPHDWIQVSHPYTRLSMTSSNYVICSLDLEKRQEGISPHFMATLSSTSYDSMMSAKSGFRLTTIPPTMIPGLTTEDYLRSVKAEDQDFGCWEAKSSFYYCIWAGRYDRKIQEIAFEVPFDQSSFELSREQVRLELKIYQTIVDKIDIMDLSR